MSTLPYIINKILIIYKREWQWWDLKIWPFNYQDYDIMLKTHLKYNYIILIILINVVV
jgi:hypothetical protein